MHSPKDSPRFDHRRFRTLVVGSLAVGLVLPVQPPSAAESAVPITPGGSAAPSVLPAGPQPKVQVEAETIDLGAIVEGDDATATFKLTNVGAGELKILQAKPG